MSYQAAFLVSYLEREFCRLEALPPRLPLTRDQRKALFSGLLPKVELPGAELCPVEVGHVEVLSRGVRLTVTDVRRTNKGMHRIVYDLDSNNLGSRYMATQHGQLHPQQYVTSPAGSIDREAGQAVDDFTQKRITREARERGHGEIADAIAAAEKVITALKESGKAPRSYWPLRRELDRFIQREKRKAA